MKEGHVTNVILFLTFFVKLYIIEVDVQNMQGSKIKSGRLHDVVGIRVVSETPLLSDI